MGELARTLGKATKALRLERGWSQEFLAEKIGLDQTYVSKLERGYRNPALSTIERLAEALEVDAALLLTDMKERYRMAGVRDQDLKVAEEQDQRD